MPEESTVNITSGQLLNELLKSRCPSSRFIPFNEAMIKGSYTAQLFSDAFICERAACHGVTEESYRGTMKDFLDFLTDVNAVRRIVCWFGGEPFCLANKAVLLDTLRLKGYAGSLTVNTVDEETGRVLSSHEISRLE